MSQTWVIVLIAPSLFPALLVLHTAFLLVLL